MQRRFLKILVILSGSIFFMCQQGFGQISTHRLRQADSLFLAKRYTQSMEQYRSIFAQHEYSPAMLLKMAYIEEGLNQTGQALYYLNLYYQASRDKAVLEKMEDLAKKYNLEGYQQTDASRIFVYYQDHHFKISVVLAVIIFFVFSLMVFFKRLKRNPAPSLVVLVLLLITFGAHINFGEQLSTGIVSIPNTYLMDGPSPGASVVSKVDAGHRVEILGRNDVWIKILWQGEAVYVKENNLLPITL
ncbi:MAG TPA: SH3 domain-containing protein [Ohtaekwangia sp.]